MVRSRGRMIFARRARRRRGCFAALAVALLAALIVGLVVLWAGGAARGVGDLGADGSGLPQLYSEYAVLEDASGAVIAEKGAHERMRPASMTKMMTVLVAVERIGDLDAPVTVTGDDFAGLYEANASLAGFEPGERTTARELVYGALLPSGAECCQALARVTAGSTDAFVALMNERAAELGMTDTHFCNTTGLDEDGHYSTVADMATLLRAALQNEDFRAAFTCATHVVPPTNQHPGGFTLRSTLSESLTSYEVPDGRILGGKTGYTEGAGLCLASAAEVDGRLYVLVTAHAPGAQDSGQNAWDAVTAYTWLARR
ncbi:D-alanyl-D-alanine carboxypeptidase [Olsenella uli]|uniref:D-alanyl-D-alanine carboxypeptidase family protein n=1 Tax=Olsenella uli TaxID=133926 RepID=UPI00195AFBB8|nr:serine hydrolase [Olsenella uli]MBM6676312.1 D-alanyl-D-alanine carboxypeptidase [Olsenella uli]